MSEYFAIFKLDETLNGILSILGFIITIVSFIAAFILYFKAKREKLLRYLVRSNNLIDGKEPVPGLKVSFHGNSVGVVTVTDIAVWNAGKETIRRNDFPSTNPLRIYIHEKYQILDARVIGSTRSESGFKIAAPCSGYIDIDVEFLDFEDGAVVEIVHTGTRSDDLRITGTVMGGKTIRRVSPFQPIRIPFLLFERLKNVKLSIFRTTFGISMLLTSVLIPVIEIYSRNDTAYCVRQKSNLSIVMLCLLMALYIYGGVSILRKDLPKKLLVILENK